MYIKCILRLSTACSGPTSGCRWHHLGYSIRQHLWTAHETSMLNFVNLLQIREAGVDGAQRAGDAVLGAGHGT